MTQPHHAPPHTRAAARPRPVTVPLQSLGANPPVITSPCRLVGWSLIAGPATVNEIELEAHGAAAAATALNLTGFAGVQSVTVTPDAAWPAGDNQVSVSNVGGGTISAEIQGGSESPVTITFNPITGVTGTPVVSVPALAGGPAYTVLAQGVSQFATSASAVAQAALMDAGQPLAEVAVQAMRADTEWISDAGVYVGTSISFNVAAGSLYGVVYVLDNWHGGEN